MSRPVAHLKQNSGSGLRLVRSKPTCPEDLVPRPTTLLLPGVALVAPALLHLLGADLLLLPVLVVVTAALLRTGELLLDRLVLGAILTTALLLGGGLLFSLWPWGLHPLAVGWTYLGGLAVASAITGRAPALPRRLDGSDLVVLGAGALALWAIHRPVTCLSASGRLTYAATTLDRSAHFALFDTIRHLGSFAFLDQGPARLSVQTPTEAVYPQGMHYLFALVETFRRGGSRAGAGVPELAHYFTLVLVTYALLVLTLVWAARWVAGPVASTVGRSATGVLVAALALGGPLAVLVPFGADSETAGLLVVAAGVALVLRPPDNVADHLLLASAAVVASVYCYSLYADLLVVGFGVSLLVRRFPLWRERRLVLLLGGPAAVVAAAPVLAILTATFDLKQQALIAGARIPLSPWLVVLLAGLAVSAAAARRHDPVARGVLASTVAVAVVVGGFALYSRSNGSGSSYYTAKLVAAGYAAVVPGMGVLGLLLPRAEQAAGSRERMLQARRRSMTGLAAAVLVLAAATSQLRFPGTFTTPASSTAIPLLVWSSGAQKTYFAARFTALERLGVLGDGVPTLVLVNGFSSQNSATSFFVASFDGTLGLLQPALLALGNPGRGATPAQAMVAAVAAAQRPVRVLVADPRQYALVRAAMAARRDLHATVRLELGIAAR